MCPVSIVAALMDGSKDVGLFSTLSFLCFRATPPRILILCLIPVSLYLFFFASLCAATDGLPLLYLSCFAHQAREWTSCVVERESTLFLLGNAVNSRCLHVYISVCCWCCCCFDPPQKIPSCCCIFFLRSDSSTFSSVFWTCVQSFCFGK